MSDEDPAPEVIDGIRSLHERIDELHRLVAQRLETEGVHAAGILGSDFEKGYLAQTPLGRIGQPVDIAPAAVFLASDDSSWITGETFTISGGFR